MENCSARHCNIDQVDQDSNRDKQSRLCLLDDHPVTRAKIICPQPLRSTSFAYFGGKPKRIFPVYGADCVSEILDLLTSKDEPESDSDSNNQSGYFCGSPPMRTSNPVIHDAEFIKQAEFVKQAQSLASPGTKQSAKVEVGSPSCASAIVAAPEVRIVGFAVGSPDILPSLTV